MANGKADLGVKVGRIYATSFTNVEEEQTFDPQLDEFEALKIYYARFNFRELAWTPTVNTHVNIAARAAVHAEETAREDSIVDTTGPADGIIRASDIVAQWSVTVNGQQEATTRGGSSVDTIMMGETWPYRQMLGDGLLIKSQLTLQVRTTTSELVVDGFAFEFWYERVRLSTNEMAKLLISQR